MTKPRREKLAELVESFHARSGSHRRENSANSMIAATYDQCADELSAILNESEEAAPVAIPEGWKLVPKDFRKLAPHAWKPFQEIRNGNWSEDVAWEELLATAPQPPPVAWINHCDRQAISALRYLAYNDRQMAGSGSFNTEHLLQIAEELERSIAAAPRAYGSEILVDGLDNDALFALVKAGHREGDETIREITDEQCDRAAAQAMDRIAAARGMHALDLNHDITSHHSLRRELVRAGAALTLNPPAPAGREGG